MAGAQPYSSTHRVLWIDDECDEAGALLLTLEGFVVDTAPTGQAGLSMASAHRYDGIVLDKRLPDMSGLMVLQQLRSRGVTTPVMLLTGFADIESAVAATRLGAIDYRQKPLFGEAWVESVRRLVRAGPGSGSSQDATANDTASPAVAHVRRPVPPIIRDLRELERHDPEPERAATALLARAVSDPRLGIPEYVGCAEMLRRMLSGSPSRWTGELTAQTEVTINECVARLDVESHPTIRPALACLRAALASGTRPSSEYVAQGAGLDQTELLQMLRFFTGRTFAQWRSLLAMKLGAEQLAATDEHVAQIAYSLGFDHAAQFDREFNRTFGLSPSRFRRLLHGRVEAR